MSRETCAAGKKQESPKMLCFEVVWSLAQVQNSHIGDMVVAKARLIWKPQSTLGSGDVDVAVKSLKN